MPQHLRDFFDGYRDAFNRLDAAAVSAHYRVPSMISSASGEGLFTAQAALHDNNEKLCALYRDAGFASAHYDVARDFAQGDDFYFADLCWTIEKRAAPADVFNTSYQLAKRNGEWKIEHVTAYSEKRFWAAQ
jgi:hypothetical protein